TRSDRDWSSDVCSSDLGHTNTPWPTPPGRATSWWISPQRLTDNSSLVLLSDMNDWSPGFAQIFAPHGRNGPILVGGDQPYQSPRSEEHTSELQSRSDLV